MEDDAHNQPGCLTIGRFRLSWWHEWDDVLRRKEVNWVDMNLLRIHIEKAYYKQSFEINLGLLGFNMSLDFFWG
jgi:hypothetical protein